MSTSAPPIPTIPPYINPAGFPTPGLPNEGYRVWLALVIMIISSGLFVIARIVARAHAGQLGVDDYTIVGAMLSCLVQTSLWATSVRTGYGADYVKLTTPQRELFNKWWFLGSIFYLLTLTLYKTSVILLLQRIFVQRGFQIACWITLVINGCWGLGNILGWIMQCIPIPMMWGAYDGPNGKCFDLHGLWISIAAWDVASDVWILAMPAPLIWKLNLRLREKVLLTIVFLLGAVVVVFSVMSCSAVVSSLQAETNQKNIYSFALANLFQVLESNMGIIGACLPIMRQPVQHFFPRLWGSLKSSKRPSQPYDKDEPYVLQDLSNPKKDGSHRTWHSVSVSGPELFGSARRKSDELGIITETHEGGDLDRGRLGRSPDRYIRKDIGYSVERI